VQLIGKNNILNYNKLSGQIWSCPKSRQGILLFLFIF